MSKKKKMEKSLCILEDIFIENIKHLVWEE